MTVTIEMSFNSKGAKVKKPTASPSYIMTVFPLIPFKN